MGGECRMAGRWAPTASSLSKAVIALSLLILVSGGCGGSTQGEGKEGRKGVPGESVTAGSVLGARDKSHDGNGVLSVGITVHLEGWKNEATDEGQFRIHADQLRRYAALFEKYGAKLTLEAGPEFVQACARWGDNVLGEMQGRGHGIGVHADLGGRPGENQQDFTDQLRSQVQALRSLGCEVRHASGICSYLDWIKAAEDAGLGFVDCVVEYGLKSIPEESLPPEYRKVVKSTAGPSELHRSVPYQLADRVYPWRADSGENWLWEDPEGEIVILSGNGGASLPGLAEEAAAGDPREAATPQKVGPGKDEGSDRDAFDQADIDEFVRQLREAQAYTSTDRVTVYYVTWSFGQALDPGMLESFLQSVKRLTDTGRIQWKTIPEMYDAYRRFQED